MKENRRFFLILILTLQFLNCQSTEEIFEVENLPEENRKFVPGRQDILMHQQTEAIRRIVHAKSLELQKPFDLDDSLLLTRCQEIANQQRSNTRIQAEALTNEDYEATTTIHLEENKIDETTTKKIEEEKTTSPKSEVKNPDSMGSQTQNIDQVVNQEGLPQSTPNQMYNGPPLYYIYPQYIQNVPEVPETTSEVSTSTTTTSTTTQAPPPLFTEKLRFVLRLPYPLPEKLSNYPYEFDRYAYFPKNLQPSFVNMAVPYKPTYHMIRRLVIPSKVPSSYIVETNK